LETDPESDGDVSDDYDFISSDAESMRSTSSCPSAADEEIGMGSEDEGQTNDYHYSDLKLYPGCRITVFESALLLMAFFLHFKLSYRCMTFLMKLLELHLPAHNNMIKSVYLLKKYFSFDSLGRKEHKFCVACKIIVATENCENCNSRNFDSFFIFDMESQFKKLFSRPQFLADLTKRTHLMVPDNLLHHITDGSLYKSVKTQFQSVYDFSLMLYTDGMNIFNSSKCAIWPLVFTIIELPTPCRTLPHNIIFGGLWCSKLKPNFDLFLKPIYEQFQKFKNGLNFTLPNRENIVVRPFLLCFTADKPAKASVLKMVGHGGRFGCSRCLIKGEGVKVDGQARKRFCFKHSTPLKLREHFSAIEMGKIGTESKPEFGFKGQSIFSQMVPDCIRGLGEDLMHGLYGGTGGKKMLELWLHAHNKSKAYSVFEKIEIIEKRLKMMRPPNFIKRRLRPLDQLSFYKTSEYKNWFLYYSVPILHDLLPYNVFQHYFKLVQAIFLLNQDVISVEQIKFASNFVDQYTAEFGEIYGDHLKTPNFHSLNHICAVALELGPLFEMSCFNLESLLGTMKKFVLGPKAPGIKISDMFSLVQNMPSAFDKLVHGSISKQFISELKYGNVMKTEIFGGTYLLGKVHPMTDISLYILNSLKDSHLIQDNLAIPKLWTFNALKTDKFTIQAATTLTCASLYDSSLVRTRDEKIFRVQTFVKYKTCYCTELCDCEAVFYAVGFNCSIMQNANIPENPFINQICIHDTPTSVKLLDIVDVCALMCVNDSNTVANFCCRRLNTIENE